MHSRPSKAARAKISLRSNMAWKYQEGLHNFAGIEIQAKQSYSNLYIVEIDNAAH